MNKAEFITLIDNPGHLDKSHITALKNIAADFPYFQANHILLAKALFNENHYEFEKQLKSTALLVSNRELLYRFLHDLDLDEATATLNAAPGVETAQEILQEQVEEHVIETPLAMPDPIVVEEPLPAIPLQPEEPEPVIIAHTETAPLSVTDQEEPEIPVPDIIDHRNETHSFTEWLMLGSLSTTTGKEPKEEEKKEEPVLPQEKVIIAEAIPLPEDKPVIVSKQEDPAPKSNINKFESILDKFIRENPSISRPKAEFYKPAMVARQSVEEDDDLVTETLANIYYQQGAYKKAIRAYEKLCLVYPHKMTFFAALIQKIKEENKND